MKLTERRIEELTVDPGRKDRLVSDDDQRGLYVRVTKGTKRGSRAGKSFLCKFTLHGKKEKRPLGSFAAISLADAREAAAAIMGDIARGKDPAAEHREAKAAAKAKRQRDQFTVRVLIDDWKQHLTASRRPRYAEEAVRALHRAFADRLDDPAEDLDRTSVVRALDALVRRRGRKRRDCEDRPRGIAMRDRTAAYGRAAFTRAVKRGLVHSNPFKGLPIERATSERDRVLNDEEIAEIWTAASEAAAPFGSIVLLLLLTGQRRGEVAGLPWSELSNDLSTWTIPRERAKNGVANTIPLSEPVRRILRALVPEDLKQAKRVFREQRARGELVLPGAMGTPFSGWSKTKKALDKEIMDARTKASKKTGITPAPLIPWNIHDLRRTVATGLQRLGVRLEVTEAVLNHTSGSRGGIAGVYQRHDWATEKRAALDAWAHHVLEVADRRSPVGNVVKLARHT